MVLGLSLMRQTISLFSRVGEGTLAPWDPTQKLVVEGVYRRVRNPMITGVVHDPERRNPDPGRPGDGGLDRDLRRGERDLHAARRGAWPVRRFGQDYLTYRGNVPRWIPRRRPWTPTFAIALVR